MAGTPAKFTVLLTAAAERDLEALYGYRCEFESPARVDRVLDRLMTLVASLAQFPERGSHPEELLALGIREFRQTAFKPYRVIYRVIASDVFVLLIADGRRQMQSLLARRLLAG